MLVEALQQRVGGLQQYASALDAMRVGSCALHLAIMREPYLGYVMKGSKTIESRFSMNRIAPYGWVARGDVLILKGLSSQARGVALVDDVFEYRLDDSTWSTIHDIYEQGICAPLEFYSAKATALYATLMHVKHVVEIEPLEVSKRDRRGWVVLIDRDQQLKFL